MESPGRSWAIVQALEATPKISAVPGTGPIAEIAGLGHLSVVSRLRGRKGPSPEIVVNGECQPIGRLVQ